MGINWSNNSAKFQSRPSGGHIFSSTNMDSGGASAYTFTGIPSDASVVTMIFKDFSVSSNASGSRLHMRMGNGNVNSSSVYSWACDNRYSSTGQTEGSRNDDQFRILHSTHTSHGHIENGVVRIMRNTTSTASQGGWFVEAHFGDHHYDVFFNTFGRYQTSGPIDRVYIWNPSGHGFDENCFVHLSYETGDGHN